MPGLLLAGWRVRAGGAYPLDEYRTGRRIGLSGFGKEMHIADAVGRGVGGGEGETLAAVDSYGGAGAAVEIPSMVRVCHLSSLMPSLRRERGRI